MDKFVFSWKPGERCRPERTAENLEEGGISKGLSEFVRDPLLPLKANVDATECKAIKVNYIFSVLWKWFWASQAWPSPVPACVAHF